MREIKFRGWDKKEKVMCPVTVINLHKGAFLRGNSPTPDQWISDRQYISGDNSGHFVRFEDMELMQFTELRDNNGKQICEGDIMDYNGDLKEIIFSGGSFGVLNRDGSFGSWRIDDGEVIGNIYEDPELIPPKK